MMACSSVLHIMFIADVLISDILALEIDVHYMISKIPSDSISEHLVFKNFLGSMHPDPPNCASHNNAYNYQPLYKIPHFIMCL